MVSNVVCFTLMLAMANAATFMGYLPQKPIHLAHKPGCYIQEINDVIPFNEDVTPIGFCMRIECTRNMLYYATCGKVFNSDPNCHLTEMNLNKPYPDCCPNIKCDHENNLI